MRFIALRLLRRMAALVWVGVCVLVVSAVDAAAARAQVSPPATEPTAPAKLCAVVVPAAAIDVDDVVADHLTQALVDGAASEGHAVLGAEATDRALASVMMPYPPASADLWRATRAANCARGLSARVWASGGKYVLEVSVASLDGMGPFLGRATATETSFDEVARQLVAAVLPSAREWRGFEAPVEPNPEPPAPAHGAAGTRPRRAYLPFRLSAQTEGVFGVGTDFFYTQLVGARFDYFVSHDVALGAYAAYGNLRGKEGREHNLVAYLMAENRVELGRGARVTIPLRFALGYVPFNGPVVRLSGGVNVPLGRHFELGVDLIAPTFWILPNRTVFALDVGAELGYRF